MLEEEVTLTADYVHVIPTRNLRSYIGDPTFLAVLCAAQHRTRRRGFLVEVELGLAHVTIDMLLGGGGEAISLRPLTEIEEGVMTYVIVETLEGAVSEHRPVAAAPACLEGVCPQL